MDATEEPKLDVFAKAFVTSRALVILMVVLSSLMLYSSIRHPSSRFHIPQHFAVGFEPFGRAGLALDLFCYIAISGMAAEIVRSTRDRLAILLFVGMMGPFVINPLKMLLPQQASLIWWVELCLHATFFVTSIAALIRGFWDSTDAPTPDAE